MLKQFSNYCSALMVLTSVHHIYGAYLYETPWRMHVLAFSAPVIIFNWFIARSVQKRNAAFHLFLLVNLVFTILLIGMFEGAYNHLVKNILFFGGVRLSVMTSLFPPPTYIMPNDFIFELTGVIQAFMLIPVIYYFFKLTGFKVRQPK